MTSSFNLTTRKHKHDHYKGHGEKHRKQLTLRCIFLFTQQAQVLVEGAHEIYTYLFTHGFYHTTDFSPIFITHIIITIT